MCRAPTRRPCWLARAGAWPILRYTTHALAENRHGLIVDVHTPTATGTAEREAALVRVKRNIKAGSPTHKPTLAADKGYDRRNSSPPSSRWTLHRISPPRPKAVQFRQSSNRLTAMRSGLRRRKMIEEAFGWVKDIGTLRRLMARGLDRIRAHTLLNFAAYNLTRLSNLLAP